MPPPSAKNAAIYGGIPEHPPGNLDGQLLSFAEDLRSRGRRDRHLRDPRRVRGAEPRRLDRSARLQGGAGHHARQVERRPQSLRSRVRPVLLPRHRGPGGAQAHHRGPTQEASRRATSTSTRSDSRSPPRSETARTPRSGTWPGSRSPRSAAAKARASSASTCSGSAEPSASERSPSPISRTDDPRHDGLPRDQLRKFEQHLRRELERNLIERTASLPPKRPLNELDRALPSGPIQDLAAVHRVVAQLKRRLATQGHELKGHNRHAHVDFRRTMRASLQTGGVPIALKYRPKRPRRPEIFVLCDVSTSRHQRVHVLPVRPPRPP